MKKIEIVSTVHVIASMSELHKEDRELLDRAVANLDKAYAPYSGFHVGAAIRLANGNIVTGSNQENASYPLCICGERVALYNASDQYPGEVIETLAIVARNTKMTIDTPVSPCGACRQVITEYEQRQRKPIRILLKSDVSEIYILESGKELLPLSFDSSFL